MPDLKKMVATGAEAGLKDCRWPVLRHAEMSRIADFTRCALNR
jgi:hypothetical protein